MITTRSRRRRERESVTRAHDAHDAHPHAVSLSHRGDLTAQDRTWERAGVRAAFLFLLSLFTLTHCERSNTLIIGTDATYPPFEYKDDKGEFTGVSIELGRALAQHLGRPVEFRNIAFDGLIPALQTGSIDLIISSMTANEKRRQSLDFSDPYVTTGICLLLPKASTIKDASELKQGKRRIVTKIGTTGEQWARANLPEAQVLALDTDGACVMELAKNTADAWVYDQISVMNYAQRNPDTTRAELKPVRIEQWAIGLKQGQPQLREQINAFLKAFREKHGFEPLAQKYLAKERTFMREQGIPFVFDLPTEPLPQ
jgi:polar amino acid transport system substrate-binding protein